MQPLFDENKACFMLILLLETVYFETSWKIRHKMVIICSPYWQNKYFEASCSRLEPENLCQWLYCSCRLAKTWSQNNGRDTVECLHCGRCNEGATLNCTRISSIVLAMAYKSCKQLWLSLCGLCVSIVW